MSKKIKYFIQIDTGFSYLSELIEISKESFDTEFYKCSETVKENKETCFMKENIDEFDNRIQTEYIFGIGNMCIFLIKLECKEGYKFIKSKAYYEVQVDNDKHVVKRFKSRVEVLKYYDKNKSDNDKLYLLVNNLKVAVVKE